MKNKKRIIAALLCLLMLFPFGRSVNARTNASAEMVSEVIQGAAPTEFGYLDNTEYYVQYYFSSLSYVDDCCITVCSESTNFNEFGVFHVKSKADANLCAKQLKKYLEQVEERFRSGVIYDIDEYPKFKNAKVTVIGNFVIYTILNEEQTQNSINAVKAFLK